MYTSTSDECSAIHWSDLGNPLPLMMIYYPPNSEPTFGETLLTTSGIVIDNEEEMIAIPIF
jgi:hypothetical protein